MLITMNDALKLKRNFAPGWGKYSWEISRTGSHLAIHARIWSLMPWVAKCSSLLVYQQRWKSKMAFSFYALIYYTIHLFEQYPEVQKVSVCYSRQVSRLQSARHLVDTFRSAYHDICLILDFEVLTSKTYSAAWGVLLLTTLCSWKMNFSQ